MPSTVLKTEHFVPNDRVVVIDHSIDLTVKLVMFYMQDTYLWNDIDLFSTITSYNKRTI